MARRATDILFFKAKALPLNHPAPGLRTAVRRLSAPYGWALLRFDWALMRCRWAVDRNISDGMNIPSGDVNDTLLFTIGKMGYSH